MINTMYAKFAEVAGDTLNTRVEFNYLVIRDFYYSKFEGMEDLRNEAAVYIETHAFLANDNCKSKWVNMTNEFIERVYNFVFIDAVKTGVNKSLDDLLLKLATA